MSPSYWRALVGAKRLILWLGSAYLDRRVSKPKRSSTDTVPYGLKAVARSAAVVGQSFVSESMACSALESRERSGKREVPSGQGCSEKNQRPEE